MKSKKKFKSSKLTKPLGISAYGSLALTALVGNRKFKWLGPKWHVGLGIMTFILATAHVAILMCANKKKKEVEKDD